MEERGRQPAFIFDIDDTLYLRSDPYLRAYRQYFGLLDGVEEKNLFRISKKWSDITFESYKKGELTWEEMNVDRVIKTYEEVGVSLGEKEALEFQKLYKKEQEEIQPLASITKALQFLHEKGCFLGVVSNGNSRHQREKFAALRLDCFIPVDHLLISDDIGIYKPDPAIFSYYERKHGLTAERCYYLGDDPEADVKGSLAAGWNCIWPPRNGCGGKLSFASSCHRLIQLDPEKDDIMNIILQIMNSI